MFIYQIINQVICKSVVDKRKNITKQTFKSRDSQNALLAMLSRHIPQFFDTDVFPYGGSDFTVSKGAFGKVTLLEGKVLSKNNTFWKSDIH